MSSKYTDQYIVLIRDFLTGAITPAIFETEYLRLFQKDETQSRQEYEILGDLFSAVDCYTTDDLLPHVNPDFAIDERQLREAAQAALDGLVALYPPDE